MRPARRRDATNGITGRRRVLINAIHAKSGGGVTHLRGLLPLLADMDDLDIHMVLSSGQEALLAEPMPAGVVLHRLNLPAAMIPLLVWEQVRLPALARRLGADVVFCPANYGPLALRRQVVTLTNALAVGKSETRLGKRLYWTVLGLLTRASLWRAQAAIAVSAYVAEDICPPALRHKVTVIPHGVAPFFHPDPAVAREDFVLAVSDIYIQKNLHVLVEAFAALAADHGGLHLRIAGRIIDSDYHRRLLALVAGRGLGERVHFLGHCDRVRIRHLYRSCRLFVFPSTVESFGMPVLEAMACAAPVVCSNTTAMPEVAGPAAVLFDPASAEALGAALVALLADGPRRAALGQAGQARAARFTWQRAAEATATVLRKAMRPD